MKLVISKNDLVQLIGKIQNVVSVKPPMPILSNFLIEAIGDELILTATDLTVGMRCFTDAKILEEGAITLPARYFFQLVKEVPNVPIEISVHTDQRVDIVAGASKFKLHGARKEDFPTLPELHESTSLKISQENLHEAFYKTAFAVSKEDQRFVLTGVFFQVAEGSASFVGTDGKKLAQTKAKVDCDPGLTGSAVIPLKAIEEVQKLLTKEGDVKIYLMSDKIAFETDQGIVISKLLIGEYPDFRRVIPEVITTQITLHREELISCLRQVSLFMSEQNSSARFSFTNGELHLSANSMNIGEGDVSMAVNYSGEPFHIAFNPVFFWDILRHIKDETIQLGMVDAYNPGVITDSSSALFIIMPMRLYD